MNSIKKELKPQTLLIIDKEGNTLNNKEKVLQRWSEYYEKHFELQGGTDSDSGEEWTMCTQTPEPVVEPKNERDQEGRLWTHLKNMGGRDHTTLVAIWYKMCDS